MNRPPFAIYYALEAYSTARKLMGRQAAGKAFLRGVARAWPQATVHGMGEGQGAARAMLEQLRADGFAGQLNWSVLPDWRAVSEAGALYYPSSPPKDLAAARNLRHPAAFSLMGVTHSLSSAGAMDQIADLVLPPFKPWDALICTSHAAHRFVARLQEEMRAWWASPKPGAREAARQALRLARGETAFLFAGRLSFHANANPAPMYQALEQAARRAPVACIEAGTYSNATIREGFAAARKTLAPSVRLC